MKKSISETFDSLSAGLRIPLGLVWILGSFFAIELYMRCFVSGGVYGWKFSLIWSVVLSCLVLVFGKKIGRRLYAAGYILCAGFSIGEIGCHKILGHMIWVAEAVHLKEGGEYGGTIMSGLDTKFWLFSAALLLLGVIGFVIFPKIKPRWWTVLIFVLCIASCVLVRHALLEDMLYLNKAENKSEYYNAVRFRQTVSNYGIYTTFYDAEKVYTVCGYYQLVEQDILRHHIKPLLPSNKEALEEKVEAADAFFAAREEHIANDMTGIFEGKNVICILMETMDDFLITEEDTPTICRLMSEGINFTNFYTPIYSSIHTFNTEFCANTGQYLLTSGASSLGYTDNCYDHSLPNQLRSFGYSANAYHYNSPVFYNRGVVLPAIGFEQYVCYEDYLEDDEDESALYDDCYMLKNETLCDMMFGGDNLFYDYIITRNAHTPFIYDDEFAQYALSEHPEYYGKYENETLDVIRCKARLVDDMFAMLLEKLEEYGKLENTVIVAFTDHYAYSVTDQEMVKELSGVDNTYLEMKTPCFIWSADAPSVECDKILNTADLLPTLLNMLGIENGYDYLGCDAFDDNYEGFMVTSDTSWVYNDVLCSLGEVVEELSKGAAENCDIDAMEARAKAFVKTSDALMETDYYSRK